MVVAPDGVLYVNTWSGRYYHFDKPPPGGFLVALKDTRAPARADLVQRFGPGRPGGRRRPAPGIARSTRARSMPEV